MAASAKATRIISLLNQKGGVGKTTTTVNIGAAMARAGRRVLLIDLDPQSNLSLHFGVEDDPDQPGALHLFTDPALAIGKTIRRARTGLDFIPATTQMALVEGDFANREGMQTILKDRLAPVLRKYDAVLIDCPPSLGVLSVNALVASHEVYVPMQAHYLALRGLEKLLETVQMVAAGLNPTLQVGGVILCMHESQSGHSKAVVAEMEQHFESFRGGDTPWSAARVMRPAIRRNIKLAEAPSFGQTIFDYAPDCAGAADYEALALALMAAASPAPAASAPAAAIAPS